MLDSSGADGADHVTVCVACEGSTRSVELVHVECSDRIVLSGDGEYELAVGRSMAECRGDAGVGI